MSDKSVVPATYLGVDYLANAALAFAQQKAQEVSGLVVDDVLNKTDATILNLDLIQRAEEHARRFLAAFLKNSIVEFTGMWTKELERQRDAMQKLAEDSLSVKPTTSILMEGRLPSQVQPTMRGHIKYERKIEI